ncbi:hypothetical protein [Rhizobium oryzicola]|uniref:Uncharacterized protein n=1 Tax=Rhizobium oryzicola TaxID=1232668 RepID=A0ABT8SSV2_9HYPH|nr:hypothetical protein [Rhizobium oryzicola]MDO1581474.1 hypothetical protein [Rhizobium oryzicola]
MQIQSGLNGYGYAPRTYSIDRKTEEPVQREPETRKRFDSAITGSSTLLSSSLASALWAVESSSDAATQPATPSSPASSVVVEHVETVYSEF